MAATVLAALAGVYGPLLILFPWMWSGGPVPPLASVLFVLVTPACWLGWYRLMAASVTTPWRHRTVVVSGVSTVLYGVVMVADMRSMSLWGPSLLIAAVGHALVGREVWRRRRDRP